MSSPTCLALALSLLALSSCAEPLRSKPRSDDEPPAMYLESCSLGCSVGSGGAAVFCSLVNTHQNGDIALRFSQPIDPGSLDASTFQVVEAATGVPASGTISLDPLDPQGMLYRPGLTFDAQGNPIFGFRPGVTYRLRVQGEQQGDAGPFVRSRAGARNQSRLDCRIITDQGVLDLVVGPPRVEVTADVVTGWDASGNPQQIESGQRVPRIPGELQNVHRGSPLRMIFADLMRPATLANNTTGTAPFVRVEIDGDGRLNTSDDRSPVPGRFEVHVDVESLTTELLFHPTPGYPSAGDPDGDGDLPRCIVVTLPPTLTDLAGNALRIEDGGGQLAFVQERLEFTALTLPSGAGATFESEPGQPDSWADRWRTGADWGGGLLRPGIGSGSGRLGELIVRSGETVVLNTDEQAFPLPERTPDLCGNGDPGGSLPGQASAPLVVRDGVFEFAALRIEAGGRLFLCGRNPAHVLVAGPIALHEGGVIDLSGGTPDGHDSSIALPELGLDVRRVAGHFVPIEVESTGGRGGPAAGDGGCGGDRHDFGPYPEMLLPEGFDLGSDARDLTGYPVDPRGRRGGGVGGVEGPGAVGGGAGGARVSAVYPTQRSTLPDVGGSSVTFNVIPLGGENVCLNRQLGGAGGGGGYATGGSPGIAAAVPSHSDYPLGQPNAGGSTAGGHVPIGFLGGLGDNNPVRELAGPMNEFLRGGAGGGGGGSHCYQTRAGGLDGTATNACIGLGSPFVDWRDHSGAPGGGGGGACRLSSGVSIRIDGVLDASGGVGGSYALDSGGRFALPGGGGAGGAVRLQSRHVELGGAVGRIDVSGGAGGVFFGAAGVHGGAGGTGLVRVEDRDGELDRHALALSILPFEAADDSLRWLSVGSGDWEPQPDLPEPVSAATSCWIHPEGLHYALTFQADRGEAPETQGWNMELEWETDAGIVRLPFRGSNPWYVTSLESELGNLVGEGAAGGGSPIAVRFQGARSRGPEGRFCERALDGTNRAVQAGSVTPWVRHPVELNAFEPEPDMLRFAVVFDPTHSAWNGPGPRLRGVTRLWIRADPE